MMNHSGFLPPTDPPAEDGIRLPVGDQSGRYRCFKVRRYGKLHFGKSVAQEYRFDLLTVDSLRKEFEIGYSLDHPGIVRYLAFQGDTLYEEYIDGVTLRRMIDTLDRRLFHESFLISLCRQLIDALGYLHLHGILHLDIKPENVMVCNIGDTAKLIDLGCSRTSAFDNSEGGTPGYLAPEQEQGSATSTSTDIYLLGRLMEELSSAAGRQEQWRYFIDKATAPDPAHRCSSLPHLSRYIPAPSKFPLPSSTSDITSTSSDSPSERRSSKVLLFAFWAGFIIFGLGFLLVDWFGLKTIFQYFLSFFDS